MSIVQEKVVFPSGQSFRLLRWRENLRDVDLLLSPSRKQRLVGEGQHWHYHEACELICFSAGSGTSFIGDQIQPIRAGDVVLIGSNLPHYWHMRGHSSGCVVQWHWGPSAHFWAIPETTDLDRLHKDAARGIQYSGASAAAISDLVAQLTATTGIDRFGLLLRCLATAAAAPAENQTQVTRNFKFFAGSSHQTAMQAVIRHIFENFRRPIPVAEILAVARMSRPTFSRQFKAHTGMSLRGFLQQVRLDAVTHELAASERTVSEIALGHGFTELSFFNRLFRRVYGCRPLEYRHRARTQENKSN
jgi:AraC-like DNA-binding protein/mannose-6-phosphate isomerase-like protein (cupin superfamily)